MWRGANGLNIPSEDWVCDRQALVFVMGNAVNMQCCCIIQDPLEDI